VIWLSNQLEPFRKTTDDHGRILGHGQPTTNGHRRTQVRRPQATGHRPRVNTGQHSSVGTTQKKVSVLCSSVFFCG
jgi:hypothetical protein